MSPVAAEAPATHAAELAAERVLLAAATLLRNTERRKPIQAKRHLSRMLRELPALQPALATARNGRLKDRMLQLAAAYEVGNAVAAKDATHWIESYLVTLCH